MIPQPLTQLLVTMRQRNGQELTMAMQTSWTAETERATLQILAARRLTQWIADP